MFASLLLMFAPAQAPAAWPFEEITLANGAKLTGLVLEESNAGIRFRVVRRPVGRPTVTMTSHFPPGEVKAIKRLADGERKILREKLAELDATTTGERKRAEELTLSPAKWPGREKPAFRYESEAFTLLASTNEEVTRRTAIRLEQIFVAYSRHFPPRIANAKPTTIYLTIDHNDYHEVYAAVLKQPNLAGLVQHPAAFDPETNSVFCGSDLRQLGTDLAAARLHHVQQLAEIAKYEQKIGELYKNASKAERDRHLKTAADERAKVLAADRANDAKFDESMSRLFAKLYHESFHAYVHNCVYPDKLPRWLNEGLAQIYETAILDGYELRVGHPDKARLDEVLAAMKKNDTSALLPLNELLFSTSEAFLLTQPGQDARRSKASYLASWAVAFHLTFERRLVGTQSFEDYLASLKTRPSPRDAFEKLVGKDLLSYEAELKEYYLKLKPDGSVRR